MNTESVALQLYTVRDETAKDFAKTLNRVAEMGYTAVEFAGYGGLPSREMAALLADKGLRAVSTHVRLNALEQDLEREINYSLDIGCSFLVVPSLPPELRVAEAIRTLASRFNEIGRHCHERGITFAYHNHGFEFAQVEGGTEGYLLDHLLAATEPALVKLEADVYWIAYAGVDPSAYLSRYSGRVPLVHLKDMTPERTFTEVGAGTLNLEAVYTAARKSGTQWYIVENDQPSIPSLESARRSMENLRAMQG